MRLHDPLHGRQACPEFIAFDQGVGQICSRWPFPPKTGTNMLHPRPAPPIVELVPLLLPPQVRYVYIGDRYIFTPKTAEDICRFRQRPPYDDFFNKERSRFSYWSLLHWLAIVALRPLASTLLTFRRVVNPASSNLVERQLSFSKFYRPRTGRLSSTK